MLPHVEVPRRRMNRDDRARALLRFELVFLAQRDADALRAQELHQRRLIFQPRAGGVAEAEAAALVALLEERLQLAGVAAADAKLGADLLVQVFGQCFGRFDAEARQLTEKANLVKAARWILERGPGHVIIKKGEHGAFMFTRNTVFFAPAYPLENVFDPTGAGDSFAGGFMGYLARTGDLSEANLRRAVVYGSAMGSFAVEEFSIRRFLKITPDEIRARVAEFHRLVTFDEELPA